MQNMQGSCLAVNKDGLFNFKTNGGKGLNKTNKFGPIIACDTYILITRDKIL
jgi:hypothetical protein